MLIWNWPRRNAAGISNLPGIDKDGEVHMEILVCGLNGTGKSTELITSCYPTY